MHPIDEAGDRRPHAGSEAGWRDDDPLDAALRALPGPATDDGDAFTAAVMRRIGQERAYAVARDAAARAERLPAAQAIERAQAARARAARRARWIGASVLVGTAVGAGVTVAMADTALQSAAAWPPLGMRTAAASAALVVLLSWAALRGGLR